MLAGGGVAGGSVQLNSLFQFIAVGPMNNTVMVVRNAANGLAMLLDPTTRTGPS